MGENEIVFGFQINSFYVKTLSCNSIDWLYHARHARFGKL